MEPTSNQPSDSPPNLQRDPAHDLIWSRRIVFWLFLVILIAGLIFIVLGIGAIYHDVVLRSEFDKIGVGSTAETVTNLLGEPDSIISISDEQTGWSYRSMTPLITPGRFVVEFEDDRVKRTYTE